MFSILLEQQQKHIAPAIRDGTIRNPDAIIAR
jgi:hypothetical protein